MKVYRDISLRDFEFWQGAKENAALLTGEQFDTIETLLEEQGTEFSEVEINDLFWFDFETVISWLGFSSEDELIEHNSI